MESVVLSIAINLASTLLVAGGRRLGEEALGDEQEQALQNAFAGAMAAMLGLDRSGHEVVANRGRDTVREIEAFDIRDDLICGTGLLIALIAGAGGALALLALFWRPVRETT